jgi:hypothetical protein
MSWINQNSYLLIKTDAAISFAHKNSLHTAGDMGGAYFFNRHVLINIYEERTYLYADFFDLKNERWARELQDKGLLENAPAILDIRQHLATIRDTNNGDGVLGKESMDRFHLFLYMIDAYMQDFLAGELVRYQEFLEPLQNTHRQRMKVLADRLLSRVDMP